MNEWAGFFERHSLYLFYFSSFCSSPKRNGQTHSRQVIVCIIGNVKAWVLDSDGRYERGSEVMIPEGQTDRRTSNGKGRQFNDFELSLR